MKKITALAGLALGSLALTAPAQAADDGPGAANNWDFTSSAVCHQELAVVPVLGDWVGDGADNCTTGNVIDHARGTLPLGD
ncbi:hypothetical protein [Streptomyces sp. NPDC057302]|uniref:hypothetical protein n=1 Tax=Streptomyces sp. NPDC057302 TaxID=3346094 RepID=UPI003633CFC9